MKKTIVLLLGFILAVLTAGCGNSKTEGNKKEFYYVPEYRELAFDVNYVSSLAASEDTLYLIGNLWDEDTYETSTKFMAYQLSDGSYKEVIMPLKENENIQWLFHTNEGKLFAICSSFESNDITGEYKESYELAELSTADGSAISRTDITSAFEAIDGFYMQYGVMDDAGNLYVSDGSQYIFVIDANGGLLATISLDDWIEALFVDKDNKVYVKKWGADGPEIRPVDVTAKGLGEPIDAQNIVRGDSYNQKHNRGMETSLLISDSTGVYTYDFETDTAIDIFNWLDADMNSDNIESFGMLADGRVWVLLQEWQEEKTEYSIALLTKTPAKEMPEKEELVYATMYLSQDMRQNIIDFNKSNDNYRITVKEYQNEDADTAMMQFHTDLTSGNCPDIINFSGLNLNKYVGKGVLEDLYPYMEKEGIHKEDYMTNVFQAYESEGKLYALVPQFSVSSSVIKKAHVGDAKGWTLDEMLSVVESSGAEEIFGYADRYSVFHHCVFMNIDEFVDWESGECYFNSDEFVRVMEFAAQFPEEYDYNAEKDGLSQRIRDNRLLMLENGISSVQEYQMLKGMFGEEITFIGYPNSRRLGTLIRSTDAELAIAAKSKNKDAAWEFVKGFISKEYQDEMTNGHSWGFPILKSSLNKQFTMDMTPDYYKDENGKKQESPKTSWGYDDFQIDIYAATQADVDAVRDILESAEIRAGFIDEELQNIITEETAAFFKGQKSAKETADIIQNRAGIYISENS